MTCKPCGVTVALAALFFGAARADADLIVVQNGNNTVVRTSDQVGGGVLATYPANGLNSPIGIGLDTANNSYVVNADSVSKYSPTGAPLGFYVPPSQNGVTLSGPIDIAFDPANNGYVTNDNGATQATPGPGFIGQYNAAGTFVQSFGTALTNVPTGIGYDPVNGRLFVSNSGNNTITVYNPANLAGTPTVVNTPAGAGTLDNPQQIAFDSAGNVYVANFGTASGIASVKEYSTNAAGNLTFLRQFAPTGNPAAGAEGVAVNPAGNVYVSLFNRNTVEKFNASGTDLGAVATGLSGPTYLQFQAGPQAVPEPGSLALAGVALIGVAGYRLSRRKREAGRAA